MSNVEAAAGMMGEAPEFSDYPESAMTGNIEVVVSVEHKEEYCKDLPSKKIEQA